MSTNPQPSKQTTATKKKSPWILLLKWLLAIDVLASVVLTVVQVVVFDALANVADYTGAGKVVGMIGFGLASFMSSLFTVTAGLGVLVFFVLFFVFLFMVLPHIIENMKQPKSGDKTTTNNSTTPKA